MFLNDMRTVRIDFNAGLDAELPKEELYFDQWMPKKSEISTKYLIFG